MGAGIGAIFAAPLAGALFAAEILYRETDLETEVVVPAATASIVGYTVFSYWLPAEVRFLPIFGGGLHHELSSLAELAPLTLLALGVVAVGILYIKGFYGLHHLFKQLPIPAYLRPVVGAVGRHRGPGPLLCLGKKSRRPGRLGHRLWDAAAGADRSAADRRPSVDCDRARQNPHDVADDRFRRFGGRVWAFDGHWRLHRWLDRLAVASALACCRTEPGHLHGGRHGWLLCRLRHAPISTIIMVTELTGDYSLLVPTMWVSTLCFVLCQHWTLYEKQVPSRLDSPAHRGDFLVDVLEGITVADVPWTQRKTVGEAMPLETIVHMLAETRQHYFPVLDANERFVGIFSSDDVRRYLFDPTLWQLANARDVMTSPVVSVTPESDLNTALKRFTELNLDELPVVDAKQADHLLGMLRRKDVIARYNQSLLSHKQSVADHA